MAAGRPATGECRRPQAASVWRSLTSLVLRQPVRISLIGETLPSAGRAPHPRLRCRSAPLSRSPGRGRRVRGPAAPGGAQAAGGTAGRLVEHPAPPPLAWHCILRAPGPGAARHAGTRREARGPPAARLAAAAGRTGHAGVTWTDQARLGSTVVVGAPVGGRRATVADDPFSSGRHTRRRTFPVAGRGAPVRAGGRVWRMRWCGAGRSGAGRQEDGAPPGRLEGASSGSRSWNRPRGKH